MSEKRVIITGASGLLGRGIIAISNIYTMELNNLFK
jgi:hypothetical protein